MPFILSPSSQEWEYYVGSKGEFRWKSNDAVIPPHCWDDGYMAIPPMPDRHMEAYNDDLERTIAEYQERMKTQSFSDEQLAEMRGAFGEGVEVVNVLTGKKTRL